MLTSRLGKGDNSKDVIFESWETGLRGVIPSEIGEASKLEIINLCK